MEHSSSSQPLPLDMQDKNILQRNLRLVGIAAVVLVIGVGAYFGLGSKGLLGSFFDQTNVNKVTISIDSASLNVDGDLLLTYTMKNTGSSDTSKNMKLSAKAFINSDTTAAFSKPWNADGTLSLRTSESLTYQTKVPKNMFPKEEYKVVKSGTGAPPSVGAVKSVYVTLYAINDQGVEEKISYSDTTTL